MRTLVFIFTLILAFIGTNLIPVIPVKTTVGIYTYLEYNAILPGLLNFVIISVVILCFFLYISYINLKKPISGDVSLIQKSKNLNIITNRIGIAIGILLLIFSIVRSDVFFVRTISFYLIIVLLFALLYEYGLKQIIKIITPITISISGEKIYSRFLFRKTKREIDNLQKVSYNVNRNCINLEFKEGLQNVQLYLTDFDLANLDDFLKSIAKVNADIFDENFKKYYPNKNSFPAI